MSDPCSEPCIVPEKNAHKDTKKEGFIARCVASVVDEARLQTIQCCIVLSVVTITTAVVFMCFFFAPSMLFAIAAVCLTMCSCVRFFNYPLWLSIILIIVRYFIDKPVRGFDVSITPLQ